MHLIYEKKEKFLGDKQMKYFTYELDIKNHRANNVDIIIEDQIPVPNNEKIQVSLFSKCISMKKTQYYESGNAKHY